MAKGMEAGKEGDRQQREDDLERWRQENEEDLEFWIDIGREMN